MKKSEFLFKFFYLEEAKLLNRSSCYLQKVSEYSVRWRSGRNMSLINAMSCVTAFHVLNHSQVQYDRSYIWIQTPWEFLERSGWPHEVHFLLSLPSTWSIFTYFYLLPFHNKIHYVVIGISFSLTNYGFLHCCCVNQQDVISHLPLLV